MTISFLRLSRTIPRNRRRPKLCTALRMRKRRNNLMMLQLRVLLPKLHHLMSNRHRHRPLHKLLNHHNNRRKRHKTKISKIRRPRRPSRQGRPRLQTRMLNQRHRLLEMLKLPQLALIRMPQLRLPLSKPRPMS